MTLFKITYDLLYKMQLNIENYMQTVAGKCPNIGSSNWLTTDLVHFCFRCVSQIGLAYVPVNLLC